MAYEIKKSQTLGRDFKKEVESYASEVVLWNKHMKNVEIDNKKYEANKTLNPIDRRHPYPAPFAPQDVMKCVNSDGKIDYKLVDDSPSAISILADKKKALFDLVNDEEAKAKAKIMPVAKRRLFDILAAKLQNKNNQGEVLTKDENDKLSFFKSVYDKFQDIELIAATAHSDIEDLNSSNIDKWKMPSFEV